MVKLVYYQSNGNAPIGIGTAYESNNLITGALADGDPYYVRYVNPTTIRIYNTQNDALTGKHCRTSNRYFSIWYSCF